MWHTDRSPNQLLQQNSAKIKALEVLTNCPVIHSNTSVADPGCLSLIRIFPSRIPDPGRKDSRSRIRIRILIFYPFRIQGSKRHRIPVPGSGSATLSTTVGTTIRNGKMYKKYWCWVTRYHYCTLLQCGQAMLWLSMCVS